MVVSRGVLEPAWTGVQELRMSISSQLWVQWYRWWLVVGCRGSIYTVKWANATNQSFFFLGEPGVEHLPAHHSYLSGFTILDIKTKKCLKCKNTQYISHQWHVISHQVASRILHSTYENESEKDKWHFCVRIQFWPHRPPQRVLRTLRSLQTPLWKTAVYRESNFQ